MSDQMFCAIWYCKIKNVKIICVYILILISDQMSFFFLPFGTVKIKSAVSFIYIERSDAVMVAVKCAFDVD